MNILMLGLSITISPGSLPKGILERLGKKIPKSIKITPIIIKIALAFKSTFIKNRTKLQNLMILNILMFCLIVDNYDCEFSIQHLINSEHLASRGLSKIHSA